MKKIIITYIFFNFCLFIYSKKYSRWLLYILRKISLVQACKKTERKWGTPISLQLAIIKMESDFDWLAKPPRHKLFKVIPYKRKSSSLGYSQAIKGTWEQYKNETNNPIATSEI